MSNINIPLPPKNIFKHDLTAVSQVSREDRPMFGVVKEEYPPEGGILVYKVGGDFETMPDGRVGLRNPVYLKYPEKGFPYPQAVRDNNIVKRMFACFAEFFTRPALRPFVVLFCLLPYKLKIKVIEAWIKWFTRSAKLALYPHLIDDIRYTKCVRGIKQFCFKFLQELGIHEHWCEQFTIIFGAVIEYDDSYRIRIQDVVSETTKEKLLANPRKEVLRLANIEYERETKNKSTGNKFGQVAKLASMILLFPRVKRAFKVAVHWTDLSMIQTDEADRYHTLRFSGYNFQGRTPEDRYAEYEKIHDGNPPTPMKVGKFG